MKRIDSSELSILIAVAIKCAPKLVRAGLVGKFPHITDKAADDLTEIILRQVDGEHRGVFTWAPPAPNLFPTLDACPTLKAENAARAAKSTAE
jgi:hypothetical protein